jgi:hypothetical protein
MRRKIMLFLSAVNCQACTWQDGALSEPQYFVDTVEGHEKFTAYLQTCHAPAFLLTDLVEEDFRHDTVPHLHGRERTAVLQRKLEQYYRNTPFRQALTLQRLKDGRHDDDMLFTALTNPALLTPWLNLLLENNIPLAGIYSIPNLCAALLKDIPSNSLLLLSWEKNAGLRQTYFNAGMLSFSRLTPMSDRNLLAATASMEATRTQQYLKNLSLLPPGQPLDVYLICHALDRPELLLHLSNDDNMNYNYLDIHALGKQFGLKTDYSDADATLLFLQLLATRPPLNHYATAQQTHLLSVLQLHRSLYVLSAVLAAGCLLWTAANIKENLALKNECLTLLTQSTQLTQQARQIVQRFPVTLASANDMKTAVLLSRQLGTVFSPPQIMLDGLAKALDAFPAIRIDKLSWQTSLELSGATTVAKGSEKNPFPTQVILLSGNLTEFSGGYRAALSTMEGFRQLLNQYGYSVTALTLPLDISPQGSIAADTCDGSFKPAEFSLKISWQRAL